MCSPEPEYVLATVEQVGPGRKDDDGQLVSTELHPGQIVLVQGYSFRPESKFAICTEGSVVATLQESEVKEEDHADR